MTKKNKKKIKKKRLLYKWIERLMPVCPDCGDVLIGNNSLANPFHCIQCDCDWTQDLETKLFIRNKDD